MIDSPKPPVRSRKMANNASSYPRLFILTTLLAALISGCSDSESTAPVDEPDEPTPTASIEGNGQLGIIIGADVTLLDGSGFALTSDTDSFTGDANDEDLLFDTNEDSTGSVDSAHMVYE